MNVNELKVVKSQTAKAIATLCARRGVDKPTVDDVDDAISAGLLAAIESGHPQETDDYRKAIVFGAFDYIRAERRAASNLRNAAQLIGKNRIAVSTDYRLKISDVVNEIQMGKINKAIDERHIEDAVIHLTPRQIALLAGKIEFVPTDRFEKKSN